MGVDQKEDDRRIQEALREAHREEQLPPFRPMWEARPRRTGLRIGLGALILAGTGAAAALAWLSLTRPSPQPPVQVITISYRPPPAGPTDFLLDTPGHEILSTTPAIGGDAEPTKGFLR